jgi:hypothetical protein
MDTLARPYPANLTVDFPERPLNRLTTGLRFLWIIPIAIVLGLLDGNGNVQSGAYASAIVVAPTVLMLLFRQKYPRWWFDWNFQLTSLGYRVASYAALLRDEYPSTDEDQSVHVLIVYPDAMTELNRWLPLVKWLLAIPHYIVLAVLGLAAAVCIIIAWFAILFTGNYPRSLFDFVVAVFRWGLRVSAYAFLLVTDRYPPFSLQE